MKSISSYLSLFYLVILITSTFLFTSCEPNNERVGGFPPEGQIWVEVENVDYTFSEAGGTIPSLLNTYTEANKALSIYRTTYDEGIGVYNFRVVLTQFDLDDTTPRILDKQFVLVEYSQGNTAFIGSNNKGDVQFEILSIENDVIKANFSGTLEHRDNPNQQLRIRNGALNIKIRRE